jgi:hypothetical protein
LFGLAGLCRSGRDGSLVVVWILPGRGSAVPLGLWFSGSFGGAALTWSCRFLSEFVAETLAAQVPILVPLLVSARQ